MSIPPERIEAGLCYLSSSPDGPRGPRRGERNLLSLAHRLRRLAPSPRNPDAFHEEKSDIVHELRKLAMEDTL